jgi:hypothetical protein
MYQRAGLHGRSHRGGRHQFDAPGPHVSAGAIGASH